MFDDANATYKKMVKADKALAKFIESTTEGGTELTAETAVNHGDIAQELDQQRKDVVNKLAVMQPIVKET